MDDDQRLARLAVLSAGRCIDVVCVDTADRAIAAMRSGAAFDGVIIDLERLEADGLAVVAAARELIGDTPVLVVSGTPEAEVLNRVHAMRADYVVKRAGFDENLLIFLRGVMARCVTGRVACSRRLEALATRAELTVRETEVLTKALGSVPRSRIADSLGLSPPASMLNMRVPPLGVTVRWTHSARCRASGRRVGPTGA